MLAAFLNAQHLEDRVFYPHKTFVEAFSDAETESWEDQPTCCFEAGQACDLCSQLPKEQSLHSVPQNNSKILLGTELHLSLSHIHSGDTYPKAVIVAFTLSSQGT